MSRSSGTFGSVVSEADNYLSLKLRRFQISLTDPSSSLHRTFAKRSNAETNKIEGLPKPWLNLLQNAKISEADQSNNPKAVVDALKYYCQAIKKPNQNKYLVTQDTLDRIRDVECDWKRTSSEDDSIKSSSRDDLLSIEDLDYFSDSKPNAQTDGLESKHVKLIGDRQKLTDDLSGHTLPGDQLAGVLSNKNSEHIYDVVYDVVPTVPRKLNNEQKPLQPNQRQQAQENDYANINHHHPHQTTGGDPPAGQPNSHQTFIVSNTQQPQQQQQQTNNKAANEPQPRRRNNKKINNPETERQLIQTLKVRLCS